MLTTLRIKNLALVADLTLELRAGFNAITGETGAGKSIIIGAVQLVLGERADRNSIRAGSDNCSVEAVFDITGLRAPLKDFLEENGLEPCEGNQLLLKRSFTASGTNRQFVNGSPTALGVLATLGEWLVDLHGPHDHQSLLKPAKQLELLDAFGGLEPTRLAFGELTRKRIRFETERAALIVDEKTYALQLDLLRHQAGEIEAARLKADEEEQLEAEYHRASNAAKLAELSQGALRLLSEDDQSLLNQAGALGRVMQELRRVDPATEGMATAQEQLVASMRELQGDLSHYADRIEIDPERLGELEARLDLIQSLKRKYGSTLAAVITFGEEAREKLRQLESRDGELERLNSELRRVDAELAKAGRELTAQRQKVVPKLSKSVTQQLTALGFKQSRFDIALASEPVADKTRIPSTGYDTAEFQFAPNPGEPSRPLRAIASSGELARVMLAIKTALAAVDQIPVLIFDEVDANVGGETARAVGLKMREIGRQRQVLCISHLAPVAACADAHYVVSKQVKDGRTISEITPLAAVERVAELSRMLGGQGEAARKHAEELLKDAAV